MRSQVRLSKAAPFSFQGDGTIRRLIRRNLSAIIGLATLAVVAALAASLATWAVDDPSFSHATDRSVRNILGFPGAAAADLLTQLFGIAASLVLLPPVVWGWRALFARPTRFNGWSAGTWIGGVLLATLALACFAAPASWPLPAGLGGVTGDLLLKVPGFFLGGDPAGFSAFATGALFTVSAATLLLHACGLILQFAGNDATDAEDDEEEAAPVRRGRRIVAEEPEDDLYEDEEPDFDDDEEEDDRPSRAAMAFGALQHVTLSALGAAKRRMAERKAVLAEREYLEGEDFRRARVEPSLGGNANTRTDWQREEEDEPEADYEDDLMLAEEGEEDDLPVRQPEPAQAAAVLRRKAAPAPAPAPTPIRAKSRRKLVFELPSLDLLAEPKPAERKSLVTPEQLEQNARDLEGVLEDFGVKGEIIAVRPGPVVTLYELEPAPGIKSARVIGLADDIARSMSAIACRVAVIPGKNAIGIEMPNAKRETVYLRELLDADNFSKSKARLGLCLGKTIGGEAVIADLARMPHLLVAGTTGSGKSVSINTMILSLLYRWTPAECRMIMIDPKMLELSIYDGIPHLLTPVVTDPKQAVVALKWTVREMEDRYRKMSKLGVRNVDGYNARLAQALADGEELTRTVQTGFDPDTGEAIYEKETLSLDPMPFIVVIIDEMADLMMVAGKEIEGTVQRLAQMARAAGIHVVMATQRPSVDVITGTIKANFPTRISFQVTSKIDSRTILGEQGAEQLLGQGDMLYMAGGGRITRVHGPFVSDQEVEEIVSHLKSQGTPEYVEAVTVDADADGPGGALDGMGEGGEESNDLYDKAVAIVLRDRKASTSYIQRRLGIGYNRAASIIERMEQEGVVGAANHAGKREILVPDREEGFR